MEVEATFHAVTESVIRKHLIFAVGKVIDIESCA